MTPKEIDQIMILIGGEIPDTPESWARVAMACLDQGMVALGVQDGVAAVLRRAGVETETTP